MGYAIIVESEEPDASAQKSEDDCDAVGEDQIAVFVVVDVFC